MSIVRNNLLTEKGYRPYCGANKCIALYPRTVFNGKQFVCPSCGWVSGFPADFIEAYKNAWGTSTINCNASKCVYNERGTCNEPDIIRVML